MSYIRCLNNPEELYVYDGADDLTYFIWNEEGKPREAAVPSYEIERFFRELQKQEALYYVGKEYSSGIISVKETHIPTGGKDIFGDDNTTLRTVLTFGPNLPDLIMWGVTWEYLKNSFYTPSWLDQGWIFKLKRWIKRKFDRNRG